MSENCSFQAGEMAQLITCFLCKHEDLYSTPRHDGLHTRNPRPEEVEMGGSLADKPDESAGGDPTEKQKQKNHSE